MTKKEEKHNFALLRNLLQKTTLRNSRRTRYEEKSIKVRNRPTAARKIKRFPFVSIGTRRRGINVRLPTVDYLIFFTFTFTFYFRFLHLTTVVIFNLHRLNYVWRQCECQCQCGRLLECGLGVILSPVCVIDLSLMMLGVGICVHLCVYQCRCQPASLEGNRFNVWRAMKFMQLTIVKVNLYNIVSF